MPDFRGGECHRMNGLGYHKACGDKLEGGLFCSFIPLIVLVFVYFCDVLFYGIYHSMGVGSLGVVLVVHTMWEFNIVNSKFSGIWVMLTNRVGNPTCNDMMSYMVGDPNLQWFMMSYMPGNPNL